MIFFPHKRKNFSFTGNYLGFVEKYYPILAAPKLETVAPPVHLNRNIK
jgi:hypothetical protein